MTPTHMLEHTHVLQLPVKNKCDLKLMLSEVGGSSYRKGKAFCQSKNIRYHFLLLFMDVKMDLANTIFQSLDSNYMVGEGKFSVEV